VIALVVEMALVVLVLVVGFPISTSIPLLVLASLSLWFRGKSWTDVGFSGGDDLPLMIVIGVVLGTATMLATTWVVAPALEASGELAVELSYLAPLRGNTKLLPTAIVLTLATVFASEMVFRGWLIERIRERFDDPAAGSGVAVFLSAVVYAWAISEGRQAGAVGGFTLGLGFGFLYLAGRRSLVLPIAFHGAFQCTHLVLIYARAVN
jgi:membrane protease YdiL (CAAX protease family)